MKSLITPIFVVLLLSVSSFAQKEERKPWVPETFTMEQLLAIQETERSAVFNRQDSEFKLVIALQERQMDRMSTAGAIHIELSKLLVQERAEIQKQYVEERMRLAEVHKLERQEMLDRLKKEAPETKKP